MPKRTQNQPKQISSAAEVIVYIAERLKLARSIKHMTLESVAGRLGITRKQLQNYESAQSNISVVRLWELANVLDTEPGFFLEGLKNSSKQFISNENLEFIHLFSRIRDTRIKQALLGILRKI